jgi:citrate lyase subunit beta/citryl-CoA lyase
VRSDVWVEVEPRERGAVQVELRSRVAVYYGDAIRAQVREVLHALGASHARVTVDDSGALPFVIAARVEAALARSGAPLRGDARPRRMVATPAPSSRGRLRRSRLYVPGNEPKYFVNAGLYGPDGVILDLEDSVHHEEKDAARLLVRNALRAVDFRGAERMVRINQLPLGLKDLVAVAPERPDLILLPKTERAEQIREVDTALDKLTGKDRERAPWLMPILETAAGIENALEIARASRRVVALTLGLEDYAADLGVPRSADGEESAWARRRLVNAARAAGVQPIDSVYGDVDDSDGLRRWAEASRRLGYQGMGCLHPRQIEVIHRAYAPGAEELERARRIVAAFEQAQAEGLGVVSLGSKMIDPPVVKQAQRLVALADEAGGTGGTDGDEA